MTDTTKERLLQAEQEILALNATMDNQAAEIERLRADALEAVQVEPKIAITLALELLQAMTVDMQNYIQPDSKVSDHEFANQMIYHLDGPQQRKVDAALGAAFEAAQVAQEQRPDYCAGFVAGQRYAEKHLQAESVSAKPLTKKQILELIHAKHVHKDYVLRESDRACLDWYELGLRDGEAAHGIKEPS